MRWDTTFGAAGNFETRQDHVEKNTVKSTFYVFGKNDKIPKPSENCTSSFRTAVRPRRTCVSGETQSDMRAARTVLALGLLVATAAYVNAQGESEHVGLPRRFLPPRCRKSRNGDGFRPFVFRPTHRPADRVCTLVRESPAPHSAAKASFDMRGGRCPRSLSCGDKETRPHAATVLGRFLVKTRRAGEIFNCFPHSFSQVRKICDTDRARFSQTAFILPSGEKGSSPSL